MHLAKGPALQSRCAEIKCQAARARSVASSIEPSQNSRSSPRAAPLTASVCRDTALGQGLQTVRGRFVKLTPRFCESGSTLPRGDWGGQFVIVVLPASIATKSASAGICPQQSFGPRRRWLRSSKNQTSSCGDRGVTPRIGQPGLRGIQQFGLPVPPRFPRLH